MTEQNTTAGNGTENSAENGNAAPGIQVVSQYIKDFSFENPNAPESLVSGWPQPETNVQISLRQQAVRDDAYECTVNFRIEAKKSRENFSFVFSPTRFPFPNDRAAPSAKTEKGVATDRASGGSYPPAR